MKLELAFLILVILIVNSLAWRSDQERKFKEWKSNFKKSYTTPDEEEKAKEAMFENEGIIEEHNKRFKAGKETFERGLWKRSDLKFNEKKKVLANTKNFPSNSSNLLQAPPKRLKTAPPSSVNWTALGLVHEVEDQNTCGGCYAFATVGVIEGLMLKKGITTRLSVQQIVDCDKKNLGCNGGDRELMFKLSWEYFVDFFRT